MTHLLDTDICIYWLNGRPEIRAHALAIGITNLAVSSITAAELYFGAYNSARVAQNLGRAEQFVGAIEHWVTGAGKTGCPLTIPLLPQRAAIRCAASAAHT